MWRVRWTGDFDMGTPEILVVLAALMALISLVGIGIDWIGKPLRNRRFVPRIYRYDDEKLPVDSLGRTTLPSIDYTPDEHMALQPAMPRPVAYLSMPPGSGAPPLGAAFASPALPVVPSLPNVAAVPLIPAAPAVPGAAGHPGPAANTRPSAFSDTVAPEQPTQREASLGSDEPTGHERTWRPGLALDIRVGDRKPTLADKAQRFWQAASESSGPTHFDDDDRARMSIGKAPRRFNPRTGRSEAMQLGGLRQASRETEVMMRWPDESVDPWSAR